MGRAYGAVTRLLFQRQLAARTVPAAAAKVIPHTSYDVKRSPNLQENPTINGTRLPSKRDQGDASLAGSVSSIFDLRSIGNWLMLAFGIPVSGKAVVSQPVNVTGVTIHYASNDCTAGNGTITYTAIGTTATWACQAGAAGAPVNIGAGGNFTLQSNGGGKSIRITVVAAQLPVGNQNDANINVSATLKAHAFPVDTGVLPIGLFELQHPDMAPAKYYRHFDMKLATLGWDVLTNDQNISLSLTGANEDEQAAPFDANPTAYGYVRPCSAKGRIWDGSGVTLGTVVSANVAVNNNPQPYMCGDGLEGAGFTDEGEQIIGGSMRTVFETAGAYLLAKNRTTTRLRFESGAPVGVDQFKLVVDALNCELVENQEPKAGKSGLFSTNEWRVHQGASAPEIYLVNDVAAY